MSEEIKKSESVEDNTLPSNEEKSNDSAPNTESSASESGGPKGRPDRGERPDRGQRGQRVPRFRKKVCKFCHNKDVTIDYKKPEILERFITDRGKILPRRITGTCAKHQRRVAAEIKKSRMIALLPFVEL